MGKTTVTNRLMKQRQREAIGIPPSGPKLGARIQLVRNSGKPGGKFFNQRIESLRLIDKERMAGVFEKFDLRRRSIFFEIRRLLLILRRHDVEQWLFEAPNDVSPVGPFKRVVQQCQAVL